MEKESKELRNELGQLYYRCSVKDKYVYQDWYGDYLSRQDVIDGSTFGLDMLEKYDLKLMVNNNSNLRGSWDHANDWIAEVWLPRALSLGLNKLSHIVSTDIFTTLSFEEMQTNIAGKLDSHYFSSLEEAEKWALS